MTGPPRRASIRRKGRRRARPGLPWKAPVAALVALSLLAPPAAASPAFRPGERLYYHLKWTIVIAGRAVAEVRDARLDGRPVLRLSARGRTTPLVDIFYKVRDRVVSFVDPRLNSSILYLKKQKEGSFVRDVEVEFDPEEGEAVYRNFGEAREPLKIFPHTFDPLAAAYFARSLDLKVGGVYRVWVTDGKRLVPGEIRVTGKETVKTPAGEFSTLVVVPDISEVRGVFKKSPGATVTIWITDDERRLPVMIKSRVVVGYFVGELVGMEGVEGYPDIQPRERVDLFGF